MTLGRKGRGRRRGALGPRPAWFAARWTRRSRSTPAWRRPSAVETIPGAIGYAQTVDIATAPADSLQPVALNGLTGSFGNIGRLKYEYQYWTTEYIYTYGRPTGLAAAFLGHLADAVGLNDLADACYTPGHDTDHPSAARLCALADS